MNKRRVVVTGVGVLSPIGNNVDEFWTGLKEGRNGVSLISKFDTTNFKTKFAFEVKNFDPTVYMDKKAAKRMDTFTQYAVATSVMAFQDSGLDLSKQDPERIGVVFGSGIGGMEIFEKQHKLFLEGGAKTVTPFFVPMMISDIAAGQISIRFGLKGPNYATTSACATSANALADALMLVQRGSADIMFCGGSEASITPMAVAGFNAAQALSEWNDKYEIACRPFDKDRNGFVMAEGSATLVLEEYEHAVARGAKIYGEMVGMGLSGDAFHLTAPAPEGEGAVRSMKAALYDAGITPDQVDYINAHGTSTELNDMNETKAIKTVFGEHAYKLNISSTKSMTGHLLGAAGAMEAVACVLALKEGIVPPTIHLDEPDPVCDLNYTPHTAVKRDIKYALSNSFGFGGHNASLVFKKFEG